MVCIGSIAELEELTGEKVTDLHRDSIDHLTIPSKQGKGVLRRVEEVFDCWFESGSMPYAQKHYPFENKEVFEQTFPADFIAEGLDQTRGWCVHGGSCADARECPTVCHLSVLQVLHVAGDQHGHF